MGNSDDYDMADFKWKLPYFEWGGSKDCILRMRYNISSNDYPEDADPKDTNTYYAYPHLEEDPIVELYSNLTLRLAIDTAQIARTFQDRTHIIKVKIESEK